MCENYKEELSSSIDRDEVFDELSERIANYWDITIEWETYEQKIYEAIDKTITSYTKDGNLYIEDWNMWEQDLYNNAVETLGLCDQKPDALQALTRHMMLLLLCSGNFSSNASITILRVAPLFMSSSNIKNFAFL